MEDLSQADSEAAQPNRIDRRRFLGQSLSFLAFAAGASLPFRAAAEGEVPDDPMRVPGRPARPYGERSPFVKNERLRGGGNNSHSLTPLQSLHGIVTPSSLHFERHHNGVPLIDPARHRLLIHGLVDRPMMFSVDDLQRFPATSRLAFVECSGNTSHGWRNEAPDLTVQDTHGLMSTSEWTGVKLPTLLLATGRRPNASWMLAEGADAAGMARSVPLTDSVLEEAVVCYGQNGEAIRPEQGYPVRLLIPGCEGNINVKWLRRLKLGTSPFMTRWETAKYTDLLADGRAYQFTLVMEAKSVILSPSGRQQIQPGFHEIRGLAWSGRGRVSKVEVSVDAGKNWQVARLQEPILPKCHTRFLLPWRWNGQEAVLQSRCTDETGYVQPTRQELIAVRGTNSTYHYNAIHSWNVNHEGKVRNVSV